MKAIKKPPLSSGISQKGNLVTCNWSNQSHPRIDVTRPFFRVASAECTRRRVKDLELEKLGLLRQKNWLTWTLFLWQSAFEESDMSEPRLFGQCNLKQLPLQFHATNLIVSSMWTSFLVKPSLIWRRHRPISTAPPKPSQDMPGGTQPSRLESWLATRASITILVMLIHTAARGKFCWTSSRGIHPSVEDDFSKWKSHKKKHGQRVHSYNYIIVVLLIHTFIYSIRRPWQSKGECSLEE